MTYKTYSLFLLIAIFISTPSATAQPRFKIVKLAKGIYAAIRTEPPGLTVKPGGSVRIAA